MVSNNWINDNVNLYAHCVMCLLHREYVAGKYLCPA